MRLRGVTKHFGDVAAVDGVDLDIVPGEFFAMLGPSGSGKTTMLRLIAGFELPTGGTIELDGRDVSHDPPFDRDVNTVFQDYALFPHMDVAKNVEYGLKVKKVPKAERSARVEAALASVRLEDFADRKPNQLSGGQRQRVALARALVNRPKVLLLDEPLGALDLKLREEMQVELKQIQQQVGITFIFVTHDQGEALSMSDRVAVFNHGRDRAGRAAPRGLRAPGHRVRGRASSAPPTCCPTATASSPCDPSASASARRPATRPAPRAPSTPSSTSAPPPATACHADDGSRRSSSRWPTPPRRPASPVGDSVQLAWQRHRSTASGSIAR